MEIKTKFNVCDKVWIMRNNRPCEVEISNIKIEIIGDVPTGSICLNGKYYTRICYIEIKREAYGDPEERSYNEKECFSTKKELLNSFLSKEDLEDGCKI